MKSRKMLSFLITVSVWFLLSGCAGQRWTEPLPEEEQGAIIQLISAMQDVEKGCPSSLDADAQVFWKSPLDEWAVEGYLQAMSPSFLKFIISNPLGQPIFAFASNGEEFQILKPNQYQHVRGNIRSLAIRKEIPQILVQGDWFAYLTGRLPAGLPEIMEINRNATDNSIWLRFSPVASHITQESVWAHVNPSQKAVLGYLFLDSKGTTLAEITYEQQLDRSDSCTAGNEIRISELPWGAEMMIKLKDVNDSNKASEKEFSLPVPPGYTTQLHL